MKRPDSFQSQSYTANATRPKGDDDQAAKSKPGGPGGSVRSRSWERRPENRGYTYRVGQDVDALLDEAVEEMAADNWICTKSQMARAWLLAGRDRWEEGQVEVEGYARESGRSRRKA